MDTAVHSGGNKVASQLFDLYARDKATGKMVLKGSKHQKLPQAMTNLNWRARSDNANSTSHSSAESGHFHRYALRLANNEAGTAGKECLLREESDSLDDIIDLTEVCRVMNEQILRDSTTMRGRGTSPALYGVESESSENAHVGHLKGLASRPLPPPKRRTYHGVQLSDDDPVPDRHFMMLPNSAMWSQRAARDNQNDPWPNAGADTGGKTVPKASILPDTNSTGQKERQFVKLIERLNSRACNTGPLEKTLTKQRKSRQETLGSMSDGADQGSADTDAQAHRSAPSSARNGDEFDSGYATASVPDECVHDSARHLQPTIGDAEAKGASRDGKPTVKAAKDSNQSTNTKPSPKNNTRHSPRSVPKISSKAFAAKPLQPAKLNGGINYHRLSAGSDQAHEGFVSEHWKTMNPKAREFLSWQLDQEEAAASQPMCHHQPPFGYHTASSPSVCGIYGMPDLRLMVPIHIGWGGLPSPFHTCVSCAPAPPIILPQLGVQPVGLYGAGAAAHTPPVMPFSFHPVPGQPMAFAPGPMLDAPQTTRYASAAPVPKPRVPNAGQQQAYEAYIEQQKAIVPGYAMECRLRQQRRAKRDFTTPRLAPQGCVGV
ncbi:hypothetical protein DCS_01416 [Drechmeria coniospora]|uniref:Uncharacterized protein n=1 Tax=Drechmeria coniospora TaxID=98403 RepID=A0A151GT35_DRECN|nr:hypothetical protein DCS_01416 [Drechmeria coniospora]KYK60279.1 hypothetical protein DCS_01416 [Drechmeria coniospora]